MTLFADKPRMTDKEVELLFSAGVSLLLGRAYPAAYFALTVSPSRISCCCITRRCVALW